MGGGNLGQEGPGEDSAVGFRSRAAFQHGVAFRLRHGRVRFVHEFRQRWSRNYDGCAPRCGRKPILFRHIAGIRRHDSLFVERDRRIITHWPQHVDIRPGHRHANYYGQLHLSGPSYRFRPKVLLLEFQFEGHRSSSKYLSHFTLLSFTANGTK